MEPSQISNATSGADAGAEGENASRHRGSFASQDSQTASEFINSQLRLEADAREVLPYAFDSCTQPLGPLRQSLFACLTCNPPPTKADEPFIPAGVCYSCSISCHGEHTLVELFNKRNFVCDCGTTRLPSTSKCSLRANPETGFKGVSSEKPTAGNKYNQNFQNKFCGCGEDYDPHKEKGTMFQCLGLGSAEDGGCGEDWWHPECLLGLPRNWNETKGQSVPKENRETKDGEANGDNQEDEDDETPLPPGFPGEDDFETFICYKCLDTQPWLKRYAGATGFLPPVFKQDAPNGQNSETAEANGTTEVKTDDNLNDSKKRKAENDTEDQPGSKRPKEASPGNMDTIPEEENPKPEVPEKPKHDSLPSSAPGGTFSLFLKEDFRDHLCKCASCFPNLAPHIQLREEEETYEPPLSESGDDNATNNGGGSHGTASLLDRGEAALSNIDRVRAIEGAMVYNHLRDKVKEFLKPFAETGQAVGAEDIKSYFEKLRGDDQAIREAGGAQASASSSGGGGGGEDGGGDSSDKRHEQSGY
ncbi:hypothetical protein FQN54_003055 [Arachnomyces sp. PD_36]|nr:hypothetical protein FQN54_003055 [Arachnomyces sp. PD_36]